MDNSNDSENSNKRIIDEKWYTIKQRYLFRQYTIHIQTIFFNIFCFFFIHAIKQNFIQHITNVVPYYLYIYIFEI